jgi:hypothetical protein
MQDFSCNWKWENYRTKKTIININLTCKNNQEYEIRHVKHKQPEAKDI